MARSKRLLETQGRMMARGLAAFAEGRYQDARSAFVLAADANVSDSASRIHAAHACFALQRYDEAVRWLREAFGLEPRIRELPYDLRSDYGRVEEFDEHLAALEASVQAFPNDASPLIVLGYVQFYMGNRNEAYQALRRVARRMGDKARRDDLLTLLLEASKPSKYAAVKKGE
jgi:tetratricopeptide (TPR) repeat protein